MIFKTKSTIRSGAIILKDYSDVLAITMKLIEDSLSNERYSEVTYFVEKGLDICDAMERVAKKFLPKRHKLYKLTMEGIGTFRVTSVCILIKCKV